MTQLAYELTLTRLSVTYDRRTTNWEFAHLARLSDYTKLLKYIRRLQEASRFTQINSWEPVICHLPTLSINLYILLLKPSVVFALTTWLLASFPSSTSPICKLVLPLSWTWIYMFTHCCAHFFFFSSSAHQYFSWSSWLPLLDRFCYSSLLPGGVSGRKSAVSFTVRHSKFISPQTKHKVLLIFPVLYFFR